MFGTRRHDSFYHPVVRLRYSNRFLDTSIFCWLQQNIYLICVDFGCSISPLFSNTSISRLRWLFGAIPHFQTHTQECRFQQRIESRSTPIFHNFEDYLTSAEVRLHLWKLGREAEMWRQIFKDHATLWIDWPPRFSGHSEVNGERIGWFCKHVRNRTGEFIFGEFSEPSINPFHVFCNSVLSIATAQRNNLRIPWPRHLHCSSHFPWFIPDPEAWQSFATAVVPRWWPSRSVAKRQGSPRSSVGGMVILWMEQIHQLIGGI